ncbi:MAG TPA: PEP-CTERM sorting domain-containing protein [Opitutaceae bacterium]
MKKFIIAAALSAGLIGSLHASAGGDLILGFNATGGTGAGTNLEIDLGAISNFELGTASGTTDIVNLLDSSAVGVGNTLDSLYGSNWATRSDLTWGVAGTVGNVTSTGPNGEPAKTLWLSAAADGSALDGNSSSTPLLGTANALAGGASQKINTIYANFPGSATTIANTTPGSWTVQEGTGSKVWNSVYARSQFENNTNIAGNNGNYVASDLYDIAPTLNQAGSFLGTFAINNSGEVTFTAAGAAIPEPTTYAAFIGLGALGFSIIRRRRQVAA